MQNEFESLKTFQSRLLRDIHGIPESELRRKERAGKWSIAEVIGHLADAELVHATRFRAVLAQDRPRLIGFSQEEWVGLRAADSVADLLEGLAFIRRANIALLQTQPPAAFDRTGEHPQYGPMTLGDLVKHLVSHQEKHLRQINRVKQTLQLRTTDSPFLEGLQSARDGARRSPGNGIEITELWRNGSRQALRVDIGAGAKWPDLDYHIPGPEEVYVLSGEFSDGVNRFPAGTFIHHPAGSSHIPQSETGCSLLVYYPEG